MPATLASARTPLVQAPARPGMVWISPGTFQMGKNAFYLEERPIREVTVSGFWIDRHPVTNEQFSRIVAATGYVTLAEQQDAQGGLVFGEPSPLAARRLDDTWWQKTPGADWRHPRGPETTIHALAQHPVVQIALADARAYCAWAGGDLPNE